MIWRCIIGLVLIAWALFTMAALTTMFHPGAWQESRFGTYDPHPQAKDEGRAALDKGET